MAAAAGRYGNLDRSFKLAARSVLTAFCREDVNKAFSSFTDAERERLYQMFVYMIKSLHGNIEEEFETFCQEIQVATALEKVDQFVEERNLDVLSSDKTSIEDIKERISNAKKDEIEYLTGLLDKGLSLWSYFESWELFYFCKYGYWLTMPKDSKCYIHPLISKISGATSVTGWSSEEV